MIAEDVGGLSMLSTHTRVIASAASLGISPELDLSAGALLLGRRDAFMSEIVGRIGLGGAKSSAAR